METPPLTRGRPFYVPFYGVDYGNTPAYAGKTESFAGSGAEDWKHPRLRGEDERVESFGNRPLETPPLTRGRPPQALQNFFSIRNTPAYAGKTRLPRAMG